MNKNETNLISIKTRQFTQLVNPVDIIYCMANGKTSDIFLLSDECLCTRHSLKELEEKLKGFSFLRCHAKYLINLNHGVKFDSKNRIIELLNNDRVIVAKDRKAIINELLNRKIFSYGLSISIIGLCSILSGLFS
jgi:two-component system, LytTR family, response regulator